MDTSTLPIGRTLPSGHRLKVMPVGPRWVYEIRSIDGKQALLVGADSYSIWQDALRAARTTFSKSRGVIFDLDPPKVRVQQPNWRGKNLRPSGLTTFEEDPETGKY